MNKISLLLAAALLSHTVAAKGIEIDDAWARETVAGMSMGGVFLHLENDGKKDDVLIAAATPVAAKAEIHEHINDNGVMKMREKTGGLPIAKGAELALKPGGYHIMLMGLKQELKAGKRFPLTLTFKHGGKQTVTVKVKSNAGGVNAHQHDGHDHHGHHHDHSGHEHHQH